ncbi:hypothetical protein [Nocardia neocaledoniensis]|uniref:hypothetical protein n=1 Tax=Nocardia neocaledoniensis TaxID=236511 RepID=UPI002456306A|nr:hypothetical protein [Nocardia neocaledoniensis]
MGSDNISILTYAGDGKFSAEQDIYDPAAFFALIEAWGRRAMELGSLNESERLWYQHAMPRAVPESTSP